MPHFAANLSMMFNEWAFLDRFAAAADQGFTAVEFLFPYDHPPQAIADRLDRHGLTQALFNLPPGNWEAGDRGMAAIPSRREEMQAGLARALPYIAATRVARVHLMSGNADAGDPVSLAAYRDAVQETAETLAGRNIELLLEPINPRDMPGYFLNNFDRAAALIDALALPNLKLQFDFYHGQIIHGDVTMRFKRMLPIVGHVQVASIPSRHEPDREELNYAFLFEMLDRVGYDKFVGCEYRPEAGTVEGLGWFAPYARKANK